MIAHLGDILKNKLNSIDNGLDTPSGLNFVERIAGIVIVGEKVQPTDVPGAFAVSKFPISLDTDYEQCLNSGCYKDLVPNSRTKGILYFEDYGTVTAQSKSSNDHSYTSKIRLVCWINNKLIFGKNCNSKSHVLITHIREHLEVGYFNSGDFKKIRLQATNIVENDYKIFDRYTYPKESVKFLMHPYEAFAIDFKADYSISKSCLDEIELNPALC